MVPVGNIIGQPVGGEAPVQRTLEASGNLNKRQINEFNEAKNSYLAGVQDPAIAALNAKRGAPKLNPIELALDSLAADLYAEENVTLAKRFERGLNQENKNYVAKKISELKQQENRGAAAQTADEARSAADKAFKEELDQDLVPPLANQHLVDLHQGLAKSVALHRDQMRAAVNRISIHLLNLALQLG
jgi:uncharacterized protein YllA (UPF0747 family)